MTNEIKEIYLSSLDWTKTHDNMGGVMAECVFKNNISYEEFEKLRNKTYFVLCNKDYITNLQEENKRLKNRIENTIHDLQCVSLSMPNTLIIEIIEEVIDELQGEDK